jgi:acetate kinase
VANNKTEMIISKPYQKPYSMVVPTNEELMVATETFKIIHEIDNQA